MMSSDEHLIAADRAARLRALDASCSFIVQAPAGSGKTELLIQRMLALLATANHPSEVLAITFTRKAAGEMRMRLLEALHAAQHSQAPVDSPARERWHLARAVIARDAELGWQLLERPTLISIDTFDAFSLRVMKLAPIGASLSQRSLATLQQDASALYREAARRATLQVDDAQDEVAISTLLHALDNRIDLVIEWLAELLSKRAQWLEQLVDDSDEAIAAMRSIVVRSIESSIERVAHVWPSDVHARVNALAAYAHDNATDEVRKACFLLLCSAQFDEHKLSALPTWSALADWLLTADGSWRKALNKNDGFPAPGEKGITAAEKQGRTEAKATMAQLIADLQALLDAEPLRRSLGRLRSLPDAHAIDAYEPVLRAALRVLKRTVGELIVLEQARASTDFSGVSLAARLALLEYRDEVFSRLDARIAHILVDEFQDTNPAQASLIETLVADWHGGDGHTLFLVGDPMQSIYAFRDADVGIFLDAWTSGVADVSLTPLTLSANYRSNAAIVGWVNATLEPVFARRDEAHDLPRVPFARAQAMRAGSDESAEKPSLRVYADAAQEAAAIVADIARVRASSPNDSVAIIVRAKQHASEIIRQLQAARIDFVAREMAGWFDRWLIRDLLSLTYVLAQPSDRLSWYAWLRSPMVGLSLSGFAALSQWQQAHRVDVATSLADARCLSSFEEDDQQRIRLALTVLRQAQDASNMRSLSERAFDVFRRCGGDAIVSSAELRGELEAYFSFLDEHCGSGFLPPRTEFESRIKKQQRSFSSLGVHRSITGEDSPPVDVLTVHKSKGLEWHHVYIPQFNRAASRDDRSLITWSFIRSTHEKSRSHQKGYSENISRRQPAQLLVAARQSRRDDTHSVYQFVHQRGVAARAEETKRLLYVAVTRARERLVLSGVQRDASATPRAGSLAALIDWPQRSSDGNEKASSDAGAARHVMPTSLLRMPLREVFLLPVMCGADRTDENITRSTAIEGHHVSDKAFIADADTRADDIVLGIVGHQLIEALARARRTKCVFAPQQSMIALRLRDAGMSVERISDAARVLLRAIEVMKTSTHFAFIHDEKHLDCADELTVNVSDEEAARTLRVDRTFLTSNGTRWIVDYKFAAPPADLPIEPWLNTLAHSYREQLRTYALAFMRLENRDIQLALYLPLVDRLVLVGQ